MTFTQTPIENNPATLESETYELLEAQFEGWLPSEGNLEVWLIKAFSRLSSIVREQAAETSAAMFQRFGETIVGVPPILAAPASGTSTWTMIDTAGYTIPAGTQVAIAATGDEKLAFEVVEDVVIEPGDSVTAEGAVALRAIEGGIAGNGLTADPELIDSLSFVEGVTLVGETSGGVDEEDEDTYLERLTETLQLLSLSLIIPDDFEKDARALAGVARALCLGGYNPETEVTEEPLVVAVYGVGSSGSKLSSETKNALRARQQAAVPTGVTVYVADPTYTKVDVSAEVIIEPGNEPATVEAAVDAALASYLSPARWGLSETELTPTTWTNTTKVYINEVISELDRVLGVSRVVVAKVAKAGNTLEAKDLTLTGKVPLTEVGTFTITAK